MLQPNPKAHYHFLPGTDPYCCGVVANSGYEIVHVTLRNPLPWRQSFEAVDAYLRREGRERIDLCGMQLRSPKPFTMNGFAEFNRGYCEVLKEWDLYVGDLNPIARTNVAPLEDPPTEPVLHAFSYTMPNESVKARTFVVAGAGELSGETLDSKSIVRFGETNREAMKEKAERVVEIMLERFEGLGVDWTMLNQIDVYTIHPIDEIVSEILLPKLRSAPRRGVHWYPSRPPVVDIEFEMDMRGIERELLIEL